MPMASLKINNCKEVKITMGLNIAIGSTSGAVLILGILIRVYATANNYTSLIDFSNLLMILGGAVIGIFVLFSILRNIKSF